MITIKKDVIHIIKRPTLNESEKHVLFSIVILACYKMLFETEWLPSYKLRKCLHASTVGDLTHYAEHISKSKFIAMTEKTKGLEYKITGDGIDEAYKIIQKLLNNEYISKK